MEKKTTIYKVLSLKFEKIAQNISPSLRQRKKQKCGKQFLEILMKSSI